MSPYLFHLIGEVLNIASRSLLEDRDLHDIKSPNLEDQETIIEYAADTSLTIKGEEGNVRTLTSLLHRLEVAYGLEIKWSKSVAYWVFQNPQPTWLNDMPSNGLKRGVSLNLFAPHLVLTLSLWKLKISYFKECQRSSILGKRLVLPSQGQRSLLIRLLILFALVFF